jgi:hypothetical protein
VTTIENETGDSADGKKGKEMTWSKRDVRDLGFEFMSLVLKFTVTCVPVNS